MIFRWRAPYSPGSRISFTGGKVEVGEILTLWHQGHGCTVRVERWLGRVSVRVETAGTAESAWHATGVVVGEEV